MLQQIPLRPTGKQINSIQCSITFIMRQKLYSIVKLLESSAGLQYIFPVTKGTNPDKTFPTWSKTAARCCDHMSLLQNLSKYIPRTSARKMNPHIWSIFASIYFKSQSFECLCYYVCILYVESNNIFHSLHYSISSSLSSRRLSLVLPNFTNLYEIRKISLRYAIKCTEFGQINVYNITYSICLWQEYKDFRQ